MSNDINGDGDDDLLPANDRFHPLLALDVFSQLTNQHDMEVGVSLLVSGVWVTGTMIGFRKYIDGITSNVQASTADQAFIDGFTAGMDQLVAQLLDEPFHDELAIYLRDAQLLLGDGTRVDKVLVALRRDTIGAFILGTP